MKAFVWKKAILNMFSLGQIAPEAVAARHPCLWSAISAFIAKNPKTAIAVKLKTSQIVSIDLIMLLYYNALECQKTGLL